MATTTDNGNHAEVLDDDDVDEAPEPKTVRMKRDDIRSLEAKAAKADALERRLAFVEAGVDSTTPVGEMFIKAYDGDLNPQAVVEAAQKVGALRPESIPPEPGPEVSADEKGATAERASIMAGGTPPSPVGGSGDAHADAKLAARAVLDKGGSREKALSTMFRSTHDAAAAGNEQVRLP